MNLSCRVILSAGGVLADPRARSFADAQDDTGGFKLTRVRRGEILR